MATITNTKVRAVPVPGVAPYGNLSAMAYPIVTDDKGKWVEGDSMEPAASGDVLRLGIIPAGFRPLWAYISVNKAVTGLSGKVGFSYCDGEDDPDVPQADDAWFTSGDFGTEGITERDGSLASPRLPKDAFIEVTASGAPSAAGEAWIVLVGINHGAL
jgi:hypothetical protein